MGKLNTAQALREYIDLSASIIEPCIEDIYISKRILTDEGHSPDEVDDFMAKEGLTLRRSEGLNEGRWIVLDYATVLVHIFHQDERAYYNLERLWDDGKNRITLNLESDPA